MNEDTKALIEGSIYISILLPLLILSLLVIVDIVIDYFKRK